MDDGRPFILLAADQAAHRALRGYVADIGQAIALCVTRPEAAGRTYHVASQENVTESEWVQRLGKAAGCAGDIISPPNEQLPEHLRHHYDMSQHWSLDSSRIRRELG
jgi:nucleoside-diphosphate-sugar epimerase